MFAVTSVGALLVTVNIRTIGTAFQWDGATIGVAMVLAATVSLATVAALRRSYTRWAQHPERREVPLEAVEMRTGSRNLAFLFAQ